MRKKQFFSRESVVKFATDNFPQNRFIAVTSHLNRGYATIHSPPPHSYIILDQMKYLVRIFVIVHEPTASKIMHKMCGGSEFF